MSYYLYLESADGYAEVKLGQCATTYTVPGWLGSRTETEEDFKSPEEAAARAIEMLFPKLKVEVRK
jgi:hypothetical protein